MTFSIVPGRLRHVAMILPLIRAADLEEIAALGQDPRRVLPRLVRTSVYCRALFLGADIAALGGLLGGFLSVEAGAWLVTTAVVERAPIAFARLMRAEAREALNHWHSLYSHTAASYQRAIRFWRFVGAEIGAPEPMGRAGEPFCLLSWER